MEIYYDPQFYVLELLIENLAASGRGQKPIELSKYKGTKQIKGLFEEGEYSLKIIAKHPAGNGEDKFKVHYY